MLKFLDFLALILFCSLIYWLSAQPSLPVPRTFEFQDKLHHMTAYFIMGILAWRSFRHLFPKLNMLEVVTVLFCSMYGFSDEWHQSYVPGRSSEVMDWIADTFGSGFAAYLLSRFLARQSVFILRNAKTLQNT